MCTTSRGGRAKRTGCSNKQIWSILTLGHGDGFDMTMDVRVTSGHVVKCIGEQTTLEIIWRCMTVENNDMGMKHHYGLKTANIMKRSLNRCVVHDCANSHQLNLLKWGVVCLSDTSTSHLPSAQHGRAHARCWFRVSAWKLQRPAVLS